MIKIENVKCCGNCTHFVEDDFDSFKGECDHVHWASIFSDLPDDKGIPVNADNRCDLHETFNGYHEVK